MLSSCYVDRFKSHLDDYLRSINNLPCQPRFNNSLDGGDCISGYHYADVLGANWMQLDNIKLVKIVSAHEHIVDNDIIHKF